MGDPLIIGVIAIVPFGPVIDKNGDKYVTTLDNSKMKVCKNGLAAVLRNSVVAITHDYGGNFLLTLDTTDINALGSLRAEYDDPANNIVPCWEDFEVKTLGTSSEPISNFVDGAIWLNTSSPGNSSLRGTPENPCSTFAEAETLRASKKLTKIKAVGTSDITISQDISGIVIEGTGLATKIKMNPGGTYAAIDVKFVKVSMDAQIFKETSDNVEFEECWIRDMTWYSSDFRLNRCLCTDLKFLDHGSHTPGVSLVAYMNNISSIGANIFIYSGRDKYISITENDSQIHYTRMNADGNSIFDLNGNGALKIYKDGGLTITGGANLFNVIGNAHASIQDTDMDGYSTLNQTSMGRDNLSLIGYSEGNDPCIYIGDNPKYKTMNMDTISKGTSLYPCVSWAEAKTQNTATGIRKIKLISFDDTDDPVAIDIQENLTGWDFIGDTIRKLNVYLDGPTYYVTENVAFTNCKIGKVRLSKDSYNTLFEGCDIDEAYVNGDIRFVNCRIKKIYIGYNPGITQELISLVGCRSKDGSMELNMIAPTKIYITDFEGDINYSGDGGLISQSTDFTISGNCTLSPTGSRSTYNYTNLTLNGSVKISDPDDNLANIKDTTLYDYSVYSRLHQLGYVLDTEANNGRTLADNVKDVYDNLSSGGAGSGPVTLADNATNATIINTSVGEVTLATNASNKTVIGTAVIDVDLPLSGETLGAQLDLATNYMYGDLDIIKNDVAPNTRDATVNVLKRGTAIQIGQITIAENGVDTKITNIRVTPA